MYTDPSDYRKRYLPLFEEEWYYRSIAFKIENTADGRVSLCQKICLLEKGQKIFYAVHLLLPRNRIVWVQGNPSGVSSATLYNQVFIII